MFMRLTNIGSQYLVAIADKDGWSLDGAKHYKLTPPPGHPHREVWIKRLGGSNPSERADPKAQADSL